MDLVVAGVMFIAFIITALYVFSSNIKHNVFTVGIILYCAILLLIAVAIIAKGG